MSSSSKRILVCPLDWGIGHASRCIPLIFDLIHFGQEVVIAASGQGKHLLKAQFPKLELIDFHSVKVHYSRGKHLGLKLLMQMPAFAMGIARENLQLKHIIQKYRIDAVISDNRFGCWSKAVPCVYITHQVNLIAPLFSKLLSGPLSNVHHFIISRYEECWIPDFGHEAKYRLSGMLSSPLPDKITFRHIGPLSRFEDFITQTKCDDVFLLAILSGPEPQRSLLEKKLLNEKPDQKMVIIRGLPGEHTPLPASNNVVWYNHVDDSLFASLVQSARHIVCRSGYSTLMDLLALGRSAHLIPTPGQTEQEYLAKHLQAAGLFSWQPQNEKLMIPQVKGHVIENLYNKTTQQNRREIVKAWLKSI